MIWYDRSQWKRNYVGAVQECNREFGETNATGRLERQKSDICWDWDAETEKKKVFTKLELLRTIYSNEFWYFHSLLDPNACLSQAQAGVGVPKSTKRIPGWLPEATALIYSFGCVHGLYVLLYLYLLSITRTRCNLVKKLSTVTISSASSNVKVSADPNRMISTNTPSRHGRHGKRQPWPPLK